MLNEEWSNQIQEDSISYKKVSAQKNNILHEKEVQCHEMPATINVRYLTSYKPQMLATVQNKFLKAWVEQGRAYIVYNRK